jgi:hypothetical protein
MRNHCPFNFGIDTFGSHDFLNFDAMFFGIHLEVEVMKQPD